MTEPNWNQFNRQLEELRASFVEHQRGLEELGAVARETSRPYGRCWRCGYVFCDHRHEAAERAAERYHAGRRSWGESAWYWGIGRLMRWRVYAWKERWTGAPTP